MKKKLSIVLSTVFTFSVLFSGNFNNKYVKADTNINGIVGVKNLNNTSENSAKVGDSISEAEKGWKRYDNEDSKIVYTNFESNIYNSNYNGEYRLAQYKGSKVEFKFYGTKLRVIAPIGTNFSDNITVKIDGVPEIFSEKNSAKFQVIAYEKLNLGLKWHTVEIITNDGYYVGFDAIDIDEDGDLAKVSSILPESLSLNKTSLEMKPTQEEVLVGSIVPENSENKNVIWTSSDENIATVDSNGKVVAISEGKVTILAQIKGTDIKSTCEVNVTTNNKNRAILSITMDNGITKEYDLSQDEVSKFTKWFDENNGKGQPKYGFNKTIRPYNVVKEYIVFDKIDSFEIREFEDISK